MKTYTGSNISFKIFFLLPFILALSHFSCTSKKHLSGSAIPILDRYAIENEIVSETPLWAPSRNESMNMGHFNSRWIDMKYYYVFINSTLDSVVICNYDSETITQFGIPRVNGSMINLIYFHNPDSIFLFFERQWVYRNIVNGNPMSDFILCDGQGKVVNEYSLEDVPHIYKGQVNPMIQTRTLFIDQNLIQNSKLYIPFDIYQPDLTDEVHRNQKISMLYEFDLLDKTVRMLNVFLPDSLIGKRFKSDNANAMSLNMYLINDSMLEYHFYNYGSVYLHNLKSNTSTEVFSANNFPFRNNEIGDLDPPRFFSFQSFDFSAKENIFLRHIYAADSEHYESFRILQLFDHQFNLMGCQFLNGRKASQLTDTTFGSFFFDGDRNLSLRPTNQDDVYYHVKPGNPTIWQMDSIENTILPKKKKLNTSVPLMSLPYEERVMMYFEEMKIPEGSKIIVIGFDKACVHCLEYLFMACRHHEKAFLSQNIRYLFIGSDPAFVDQMIAGYKIPPEFVWVDEEMVFKKYFAPVERSLNPLVHYKNSKEAKVIIYDFKTVATDFQTFLQH